LRRTGRDREIRTKTCERKNIRDDITEKLKSLKAQVFSNPRPITYADLPAVFVSSSHEEVSLKAHPSLLKRILDVTIQGFVTGEINDEMDRLISEIELALQDISLDLQDISFEYDALGQDLIGTFTMNFQIGYEEQK